MLPRRRKPLVRCPSVAPAAGDGDDAAEGEDGLWCRMLPELMSDIIRRLDASEGLWPVRQTLVSCACVCRRWRDVAKRTVRPPSESGVITFPSCLKEPGPEGTPIRCFIKRDKRSSTFYLYISMEPYGGKFLLAARRFMRATYTEYIISLDPDDLSQGSNAYMGKLRSDFLGVNFRIYDSRPSYDGAKASSTRGGMRFASKQISPQVPVGNFEIGQVSYKRVVLRSRGPRRMICTMMCLPARKTIVGPQKESGTSGHGAVPESIVLKNKVPRWHQHLQCWCLNFHGRVTVASVKNFQLVAASDPSQTGGAADNGRVLLQFGRVNDDEFNMDYQHPLSAFQAFAICLTSFGSKFGYE